MKKTLIDKSKIDYNDTSMSIGKVKANLCPNYSQHPVIIVGDPETVYPVVGLTHSKKVKNDVTLEVNSVTNNLPYYDMVNGKFIQYGYKTSLSKSEIDNITKAYNDKTIDLKKILKDYKLIK